ncbi:glycosyltransferase [Mannheimia cairinae]|uniref:glycosyltransferase n=1 Tax=Mannheimia cairinae TaxID=3025936 RepID=UPI002362C5A5|nr:glycosyltransferase [Mannheimia cairinae]
MTRTTGRPELARSILSVQNQTYLCKHYIFVDSEQYHQQADEILIKFATPIVTYLPESTLSESSIDEIISNLIHEEVICFLNEDCWFEPNHIEKGVKALSESQKDYAYALRNFYDQEGQFLCIDTIKSLGDYRSEQEPLKCAYKLGGVDGIIQFTIDNTPYININSCFLYQDIVKELNHYQYWQYDHNIYPPLSSLGKRRICTKTVSLNSTFNPSAFYSSAFNHLLSEPFSLTPKEAYEFACEIIVFQAEESFDNWGGRFIWDKDDNL